MRLLISSIFFFCLFLIFSCQEKTTNSNVAPLQFEYAVMDGIPVFQDEYLYDKEVKSAQVHKIRDENIYLIDWNSNAIYDENGVDYIGVKSPGEDKPTIELIANSNFLNYNGITYEVRKSNSTYSIVETDDFKPTNLNLITKFIPVELTNGKVLEPAFRAEKTVVYFWATWCKPCIKVLKEIGPNLELVKSKGIDFIPIAYNCSGSGAFLKNNNLPFEDLIVTEETARKYNIQSLAAQYDFDQNRILVEETIDLKSIY